MRSPEAMLVTGINPPDGIAIDRRDRIRGLANQADETPADSADPNNRIDLGAP